MHLEWIRKDSKIKNDPNKNLDKFNKELNTGHKELCKTIYLMLPFLLTPSI